MRIIKIFFTLGLVAVLSTGCAVNRATSKVEAGIDLSSIKSVYVKKNIADDRGTNALILEKLSSRGLAVKSGTEETPSKVDAVLTYKDRWVWDITMYMLELDVVLRESESNLPIAKANSYHSSLVRLSPKEMVEEVINNLFKSQSK